MDFQQERSFPLANFDHISLVGDERTLSFTEGLLNGLCALKQNGTAERNGLEMEVEPQHSVRLPAIHNVDLSYTRMQSHPAGRLQLIALFLNSHL